MDKLVIYFKLNAYGQKQLVIEPSSSFLRSKDLKLDTLYEFIQNSPQTSKNAKLTGIVEELKEKLDQQVKKNKHLEKRLALAISGLETATHSPEECLTREVEYLIRYGVKVNSEHILECVNKSSGEGS